MWNKPLTPSPVDVPTRQTPVRVHAPLPSASNIKHACFLDRLVARRCNYLVSEFAWRVGEKSGLNRSLYLLCLWSCVSGRRLYRESRTYIDALDSSTTRSIEARKQKREKNMYTDELYTSRAVFPVEQRSKKNKNLKNTKITYSII